MLPLVLIDRLVAALIDNGSKLANAVTALMENLC